MSITEWFKFNFNHIHRFLIRTTLNPCSFILRFNVLLHYG